MCSIFLVTMHLPLCFALHGSDLGVLRGQQPQHLWDTLPRRVSQYLHPSTNHAPKRPHPILMYRACVSFFLSQPIFVDGAPYLNTGAPRIGKDTIFEITSSRRSFWVFLGNFGTIFYIVCSVMKIMGFVWGIIAKYCVREIMWFLTNLSLKMTILVGKNAISVLCLWNDVRTPTPENNLGLDSNIGRVAIR